jgi:hypothetical protein
MPTKLQFAARGRPVTTAEWLIREKRAAKPARASASRPVQPQIAPPSPYSKRKTKVSAANSTSAPWAKLNTPEALKISTKPRATSEYITPDNRPPIRTSKKKSSSNIRWKRLLLPSGYGE